MVTLLFLHFARSYFRFGLVVREWLTRECERKEKIERKKRLHEINLVFINYWQQKNFISFTYRKSATIKTNKHVNFIQRSSGQDIHIALYGNWIENCCSIYKRLHTPCIRWRVIEMRMEKERKQTVYTVHIHNGIGYAIDGLELFATNNMYRK